MPLPDKPSVFHWLGSTVRTLIDRAAEERVESYVTRTEAEINRLKKAFDYPTAIDAMGLGKGDRDLVATLVYRRFLQRCWRDARLSQTESELLAWLAGNLGLSDAAVSAINRDAAVEVFGATLASAFADGQIDQQEREHLEHVASAAGESIASLMTRFFEHEGEQLVRSLFAEVAADGQLTRDEWKRFRQTADWLGLPSDQVLKAIGTPAKQLVEHALADARSDGEITAKEEQIIESLLDNIIGDQKFREYVRGEIAEEKEERDLARGVLPSVPAPAGVAIRAGEVVHWTGPTVFTRERESAGRTRVDVVHGTMVITDARAILDSADRPAEINHRKVLAHYAFGNCIEIRCSGKAAGRYEFSGGPRPVAIWEVAIGRANQTIVGKDDKQSRRRIPREVRQRVWQKYGGRCAECSADTYLEFDHIIPVAKGGGNSDTNVQLLCRKCNLAKSDNI